MGKPVERWLYIRMDRQPPLSSHEVRKRWLSSIVLPVSHEKRGTKWKRYEVEEVADSNLYE
jgi:hypothetical protein